MKAVIFQGDPAGGLLPREQVVERWEQRMKELPEISYQIVYEDHFFSPEEISGYLEDAEIALGVYINSTILSEAYLARHPKLKYLAVPAHGFADVDFGPSREHGLVVTNTVYGEYTIAQYAFALLLEVCHRAGMHSDRLKTTEFHEKSSLDDFTKIYTPQIDLEGKTVGVIGLGHIGLRFARMAQAFGMNVIAYSRHKKNGPEYDGIEQVSLDELLGRSDVISLHAPANRESEGMICKETIAKMKDGVILINTARGALIQEEDLIEALQSGKVYGAGLDVIRQEPPKGHVPLFDLENVVVTPHIAWLPDSARFKEVDVMVENLKAWLGGTPKSVING
ncbi:MAG: NAD(P)-dependent oxidoreductase [Eubacteriales bacterium]|nr:NAD(P)-dependent oxidoreductase [Eubacteriales bacterium]